MAHAVGAVLLAIALALCRGAEGAGSSLQAVPSAGLAGVDSKRFSAIDALIAEAIDAKLTPGAVVLIGRGDKVVYQKAYGRRALLPASEPMTLDTIFDLASLTKVIATTPAVMQLLERGRLRLRDPVAIFIPGFDRHGKGAITIRHLLTHVSGLRPDLDLEDRWQGYDTAIGLASDEVPVAAPAERFIYSDINFVLLGDVVQRIAGEGLDRYVRREILDPLGMRDTSFNPPAAKRPRIAPTERCDAASAWPCSAEDTLALRGVVHDPTARRMGGVAGHAGLFGTAGDLARFARMLLNGGRLGAVTVLSPLSVARMTSPATPAGMSSVRGLGWDIDSPYSSNRGELLPIGSFGHTGFTGTSLWVDPHTRLFVVFLSSRLHPDGRGDVTALRGKIATAAAAALIGSPDGVPYALGEQPGFQTVLGQEKLSASPLPGTDLGGPVDPVRGSTEASSAVLPGIDVLARAGYGALRGKRIGLVTNHTGRSASGESTIDLVRAAPGAQLLALFSPEHGIRGVLDEKVPSSRDDRTGVPIHSLYGDTRRPTDAMLAGLDVIVIDLQDIGTRFYTYMSTLGYVMEEAAKRKIGVLVLDRPNPVDGWHVEGPPADEAFEGFTAYFPAMPVRHGMTLGELARLFNEERKIGADLSVVRAANWRRAFWFDQTGLTWVNPSPNIRSLDQATLYPGVGAIEASNISVGRGTDRPFEQIGAPWVDGRALAAALNGRGLSGIRFYPVTFMPVSSRYAGEECHGVFLMITDRTALHPVRLGLEIAAALWKHHGDAYRIDTTDRLFGSRRALDRVKAGENPAVVAAEWAVAEARWRRLRAKYLLYR